eukprot:TRINITY_DN13507_c0_g1_i1.p1 TRINITY_DN13507_c0_g1~~TRINITY_DN13507_c0_g1_i1.p1  ORF type:complete len:224 (+),score=30.84 TRINITY_DN13507_c0_g1_i1:91-762(+)
MLVRIQRLGTATAARVCTNRQFHASTPAGQNPTARWSGPPLTMDMIMKAKKQMLSASRAKSRASTFSPTLPGASAATKEAAAKPMKEKALKKIQVNPATVEANSDLSHDELLEKAVTSASRLYDRRIRKKLNRGSIDEAIESLQILRAKGGRPASKSYFDIMEALLGANRLEEAKSIAVVFRQDNPKFSPEDQSRMDKLLIGIRKKAEAPQPEETPRPESGAS